jgi:hypothetical protein
LCQHVLLLCFCCFASECAGVPPELRMIHRDSVWDGTSELLFQARDSFACLVCTVQLLVGVSSCTLYYSQYTQNPDDLGWLYTLQQLQLPLPTVCLVCAMGRFLYMCMACCVENTRGRPSVYCPAVHTYRQWTRQCSKPTVAARR